MCGIAGLLRIGNTAVDLETAVRTMSDRLSHRGPDDKGVWIDDTAGIGLGHRRLAVLDLSSKGHQPMTSASGRFVISYNGEIYNFGELRAELDRLGHRFEGGSDTEVLLAAIDEWGLTAALDRLIGMFAFGLWDRQRRELALVRDRLGIKPLYWGRSGGLLGFASELSAFAGCPGWRNEPDPDAVASYMRWGYVPTPATIYRGIEKLPPGTLVTIGTQGEPERKVYWDLKRIASRGVAEPVSCSDAEAEEALHTLLGDAVRRRMLADVPVGAFLSGGTDSSLIVALMQACAAQPVRTFTVCFPDAEYDERVFAREVATRLGTDHTELEAAPRDILDLVPTLPEHYDEPFADSSQIPTVLISRFTRDHVTVALSGDGGDELFAGYTRYRWADAVLRRVRACPASLRRGAASVIDSLPEKVWDGALRALPRRRRPPRLPERARKLADLLRAGDAADAYRRTHWHWRDVERLVARGREIPDIRHQSAVFEQMREFIPAQQLLDMLTYLPDDILTKVDRASMAVGLEVRVPLLDHRVVEQVWTLPLGLKLREGSDKWLLRRLLQRQLPGHSFERAKRGFSVPLRQWLRGPLADWAEALLEPSTIRAQGYLNPATVQSAWQAFKQGRAVSVDTLWTVLMFQAWLNRDR